jgi:DMSO/TMAO reductase YedYZ molybdopterin-dependent catalytic subunit
MRYQDPPDAQDPAEDPRWRSLSEQADVRYRGSHPSAAGRPGLRQDQYPDQDQSGGQDRYPGQGRPNGQGGSGGQYPGQGRPNGQGGSGGQYPGQGRPNGQGGSGGQYPGQGRPNGQGGSGSHYADQGRPGGPGGSGSQYADQGRPGGLGSSGSQYSGQGRPNGPGSSGSDLWTPTTPSPQRYQDSRQAVFEAPPVPAERHWDGGQDTDWYPIEPQRAPERQPAEHRRKPDRGSRGLVAGAFTGVLSAAIALGVAMLVSAFIRPQASPVIAVGGQAINLTPTPVKEFAVAHFGTNDKTMLLGGMYVTIALIAMVIGWLARRKLIFGVIGLGAFGVLGALVALIQPASRTTDAIPALVGGVAGVAAIMWLVTRAAPAAGPVTGWMEDDPATSLAGGPGGVDRRKFLVAGTATAAVAAGSAVAGQILTNSRFNANASRAAVKLTAPASKAAVLPKGAELNIPGLSSFYTPNSSFYRVDTALVIPQVTTQSWALRVHGMVGQELNISFKDLLKMPMVERDITIMCVSDTVGGGYIGNAKWQGVLLSDVLRGAKMKPGVSQLATTDVNGMTVGVASDVALDGRDAMLAVGMNGQPLPQDHGFPVRLVVPGLYGFCSATKWITDIQLTTLGAFTPYWVHRGWTQVSPTKTESRIDTPKAGGSLQAGKVMIAGVAWAQHKGIEQVEVRVDGGQWTKATLAVQDEIDTWRQWYVPWQATTGKHTLEVRATDKTGYTQTPVNKITFPNGATGYHTVQVTVA